MLLPKKVKHRKWQVGRKGLAKNIRPDTRGITLAFGSHGLKSETAARVTSNQIESGSTGALWRPRQGSYGCN